LTRADGEQLLADFGGHFLRQFRLEGAGKPDHLREGGPAQNHRAGTAFFVQNGGDLEPRLFEQELLDPVACLRR
jgi:hypothetical protein